MTRRRKTVAVQGPYHDRRDVRRPWAVTVRVNDVSTTHRFVDEASARTFARNEPARLRARAR